MRHEPIDSRLFISNREGLTARLLPHSLTIVNANDIPPTNADGSLATPSNSDLFYLSGIEQEQTILLLSPDADDEKLREILFLRQPTPGLELWEGHKLTVEEARKISGIQNIRWIEEFPRLFRRLMCECEHVYLNSNEHSRATIEVETREARFVADTIRNYPLHDFHRLARLMHPLRVVKSDFEVELIKLAAGITARGFRRVIRFLRPGRSEAEVEAEFAHEFIRHQARFAYLPIIATGRNALALHYIENSRVCRKGELLLLDVAASYANYNADVTRTIPVSGRFNRRQKRVYQAVLRVLQASIQGLIPGRKYRDWQEEGGMMIEKELVDLGLLTTRDIRRQDPDNPAYKRHFMHGLGHPLGLDVHDVGFMTEPFQQGWVMTVEPAIYIKEEGLAVRLENDVLITRQGPVDLTSNILLEPAAIEELMNR